VIGPENRCKQPVRLLESGDVVPDVHPVDCSVVEYLGSRYRKHGTRDLESEGPGLVTAGSARFILSLHAAESVAGWFMSH
jgi:hypothetical protein